MNILIHFLLFQYILAEKLISFKYNYISGAYYSSIGIGVPNQSKLFGYNMGYDYTWSGTISLTQPSISSTRHILEDKKRTLHLYCDYRETEGIKMIEQVNIETRGGIIVSIDNYTIYGVSNRDIAISDSIGLSPPNVNEEDSFVNAFKKKGIINTLAFGFSAIDFNEGDLYLGGIDSYTLSQYPFSFNCNIKDNIPYWGCDITNIQIGKDTYFDTQYYAMFQTNQSFIIAPDIFLAQLNNTIFKPLIEEKVCNFYEYPGTKNFICKCDTIERIPDITFFFDNQGVKFRAKDLFEHYGMNCKFNIIGAEWNSPFFVMGNCFIQRFLSFFNFETKTISLYSTEEFEKINNNTVNYKSTISIYILSDFVVLIGIFPLLYMKFKL